MRRLYTSRELGLIVILVIYILAAAVGLLVFRYMDGYVIYIRLLTSDMAATAFVWLMSVLFGNATIYDPYWSVAPIVIVLLTGFYLGQLTAGFFLISAVVLFWGLRLTAHWTTTFKSLRVQDWRYTGLKTAHPRLWFAINLLGIHLFPTLVVFLVLLPAVAFVQSGAALNAGIAAGALVCLGAVLLQYTADRQMRAFRNAPENAGHVNRAGVWKYSRHPNYLGEILMWWGIYLMMVFSGPSQLVFIAGPLVNTLMFLFISIPMLERRQLNSKPEYAAYREQTGMLVPRLSSFGFGARRLTK